MQFSISILYKSEKALAILEKAGALVNREKETAKIPAEMVKEALQRAPGEFVLGARNPDYDFPTPSEQKGLVLDGTCPDVIDFETGNKRPGRYRGVNRRSENSYYLRFRRGVGEFLHWRVC